MVRLRALEKTDLDFLYQLENDQSLWEVSETQAPFSHETLRSYLENAHLDIYEARQLRFVITYKDKAVGCIDLYDYNPKNNRASIGIALIDSFRGKGIAHSALQQLCNYAFSYLNIHQLIAYIPQDNLPSQKLFKNIGFLCIATLKDWLFFEGKYKNVLMYQYLKT
ncbi:GNAT family N-acetyltransferase [Fusobacterium nucleatum]|jgi:acetyltransferase, GNAT family